MNRRRFAQSLLLGSAASAAWGCSASKPITAASSEALKMALDVAQSTAILDVKRFPDPVVIDQIELLEKDGEYFVHARSRDGAEGLALVNSRPADFYPILNHLVIPYFIGKDARDLEEHLFGVYRYRSNYKLQGQAFWCPVAWVEFALLDLLGRIAQLPLGALVGRPVRRQVPFYVASGRRDSTPEEEVAYLESLVAETGARAVKFRLGGRMSRNADALPGRTEALIPLARKVLGDDIALHGDANSSYDVDNAVRIGRLLEAVGALHFEEPCPFDHLEETKAVADRLEIPVAGGEQESSEYRFRWMIENRGVDIVQPDLQYYGGLIRSRRVANLAEAAGMPTTVHISGGFGFIYMLHFASVTPSIGPFQEYKRNIEQYASWFEGGLSIGDGQLSVPTGPGVGITDIAAVLRGAKAVG